eukprot:EG_transcript_33777
MCTCACCVAVNVNGSANVCLGGMWIGGDKNFLGHAFPSLDLVSFPNGGAPMCPDFTKVVITEQFTELSSYQVKKYGTAPHEGFDPPEHPGIGSRDSDIWWIQLL